MGVLRKRIISIFLFIILTTLLIVPIYFGWIGPSNSYESYNSFPRLNFDFPTGFYQYSGDDGLNYVTEQGGKIYVFNNNRATKDASIFLDLSERVYTSSEDGLLGLAFHPDFSNNGKIYTYHSETHDTRYNISQCEIPIPSEEPCISSLLTEFQVFPDNSKKVNVSTERTLIEINQTSAYHRGGQLLFDKDGMLIVTIGDGVAEAEVQNLNYLRGKIIRIDVDTTSSSLPYGIPTDNPFVNRTNARDEIYAYGLRNAWRGSIDPETGNLWVGDVGKDIAEEINLIEPGKNYGWPVYEGNGCKNDIDSCFLENTTFPVLAYPHPDIPISTASDDPVGVAVIGGSIYRGEKFENLEGSYIFGDYSGSIWKMDLNENNEKTNVEFIHKTPDWISQITTGNNNEIFIVGVIRGNIYELREANQLLFVGIIIGYIAIILLLLRWNLRKNKDELID